MKKTILTSAILIVASLGMQAQRIKGSDTMLPCHKKQRKNI